MEHQGDNLIFDDRDRRLAPTLPNELPVQENEFAKTALEVGLRDARRRVQALDVSPFFSDRGRRMDMLGDIAYLEETIRKLRHIDQAERLGAEVQEFLNDQG